MASFERLQSATERHAAARESILVQLIKLLLGLWSGFDRWDDVDVVAGMAARSATLVDSATAQARRTNRSFITSVLRDMNALPEELPGFDNIYPRANITQSEVYRRPVDEFIWRRRNGGTLAESREAFEQRMRDIVEADIAAADRDEARILYDASPRVLGYRRVIHPELSKSGTCGLCIVASSRIYHTDELMPLHGGTCNCDTLPITEGDDPGFRLNDDDLKKIYAAAGSTAAEDLQNTRITINEHGELGPVLVKQGDHFRTAKDAGRPEYVRPDPDSARRSREHEISLLTEQAASALAAFDRFVAEHPRDAWTGDEQQRAYQLQRAERDIAARIRQLQGLLQRTPA